MNVSALSLGLRRWGGLTLALAALCDAQSTPANKAALEKHYERFLPRQLARCSTCHLPSETKLPQSLDEFPHNPFGTRLRQLGEQLDSQNVPRDIPTRLATVAAEDTDGDGIPNEAELFLGTNPGDAQDHPTPAELPNAATRAAEFARFLQGYRWRPFEPVERPPAPPLPAAFSSDQAQPVFTPRNPIDLFLASAWAAHGLTPRPQATREVLLRRVYIDLIGLNPTPAEQQAFLADTAPGAYERLVDRLLADPRHGERWARHWMDVWRYSDWGGWTGGNQIRDSKPHIWRWRDWIVEALSKDKPYDRMITEMLAADELAPEDTDALRATGFLVRNYKMLSREQWLDDTIKHTAQGFLGVTMGCAKCHDHMMDPISQGEYYAFRAIFEPHQVRTDRLPGQLDTALDGLVRVYDVSNAPTWFFVRGDERHPLTNKVIHPAVPAALGGKLDLHPIPLPRSAAFPDQRDHVVADTIAASSNALAQARAKLDAARANTNLPPAKRREAELLCHVADQKHAVLMALLEIECATLATPRPRDLERQTTNTVLLQRTLAVTEARLKHHQTKTALDDAQQAAHSAAQTLTNAAPNQAKTAQETAAKADKTLADARKKFAEADQQLLESVDQLVKPLDAAFKPRPAETYPATSSGRRLAFARWITDRRNPLTARVAVNHVWLRHFGRGLVPTTADFGRNGQPPSHPELLDWLAAEFMEPTPATLGSASNAAASSPSLAHSPGTQPQPWSFRYLHRLMVTSAAYRMASTPNDSNLERDPDNRFFWRTKSRRLEAEAVRDNLLHIAGTLDPTLGGPDIDHTLALTSRRRSLYLRHAPEKQAEFLQIFDGASVTECYERRPSVMPQQALALANSDLAIQQAKTLADQLLRDTGRDQARFVDQAFERVLARHPTPAERDECLAFLTPPPPGTEASARNSARAPENLVLVLLNHNDFVTVR